MAKKSDTIQFLNKELKTKSAKYKATPIKNQAKIKAAEVARIKVSKVTQRYEKSI